MWYFCTQAAVWHVMMTQCHGFNKCGFCMLQAVSGRLHIGPGGEDGMHGEDGDQEDAGVAADDAGQGRFDIPKLLRQRIVEVLTTCPSCCVHTAPTARVHP
jgi:hypothetical protein